MNMVQTYVSFYLCSINKSEQKTEINKQTIQNLMI